MDHCRLGIRSFFARAQALLQYLFRAVALAFKYDKGWSLLSRLRLTLLSKSINPKIPNLYVTGPAVAGKQPTHFQRNPPGRGQLAVFPPLRRIDRDDPDSGTSLAP
jgi:hypothetical protein